MNHSYADIWKRLSTVDVSGHVESKNGLSYLSWAWAWGVLMEHYPEAELQCHEPVYESNGTATVWVGVSIGDCKRNMWLPVMDYKNKSIPSPTSRDISDARMRCMVKALALFGLGFSLYAGEDLPSSDAAMGRAAAVSNAGKTAPKARKAPAMSTANREKVKYSARQRLAEIGDEGISEKDLLTGVAKSFLLSSALEFTDEQYAEVIEAVQKWEPGV